MSNENSNLKVPYQIAKSKDQTHQTNEKNNGQRLNITLFLLECKSHANMIF